MKPLGILAFALLFAGPAIFAMVVVARTQETASLPIGEPFDAKLVRDAGFDVHLITTTLRLLDGERGAGGGVVVVAGPRALEAAEGRALGAFVARGGRALVVGDPDAARAMGVEMAGARIVGAATVVAGGRAFGLDGTLTRPLLGVDASWSVVARSDERSFVDLDGDARAGPTDALGPFIVGIASPDRGFVLATDIIPRDVDLLRAILAETFPEGTRILIDATRDGSDAASRGLALAVVDLRFAPWITLPAAVAVGVATLAVSLARRRSDAL